MKTKRSFARMGDQGLKRAIEATASDMFALMQEARRRDLGYPDEAVDHLDAAGMHAVLFYCATERSFRAAEHDALDQHLDQLIWKNGGVAAIGTVLT